MFQKRRVAFSKTKWSEANTNRTSELVDNKLNLQLRIISKSESCAYLHSNLPFEIDKHIEKAPKGFCFMHIELLHRLILTYIGSSLYFS